MSEKSARFISVLLYIQGAYFIITGIWPVIDIDSFMLVTCPKTDLWLVKTLGVIFLCEGICFLLSGIIREGGLPVMVLALINAVALIMIDCYYVFTGTICSIYLADAVVEMILMSCWLFILIRMDKGNNSPRNAYSRGHSV
jgi:hypothetical protein